MLCSTPSLGGNVKQPSQPSQTVIFLYPRVHQNASVPITFFCKIFWGRHQLLRRRYFALFTLYVVERSPYLQSNVFGTSDSDHDQDILVLLLCQCWGEVSVHQLTQPLRTLRTEPSTDTQYRPIIQLWVDDWLEAENDGLGCGIASRSQLSGILTNDVGLSRNT